MNKQDAVKRIEAIEAEARALRAIIEAPDKPALPVRWRPEGDESFVSVSSLGEVQRYCNSPDRVKFGNCFQTVDHAEIASKAVSQTLKICAAAFAADPDAGVQICNERGWTVVKKRSANGRRHEWVVGQYHITTSYPIYVHTREQAEKMAAILNAEGV